VNTRLQVEHPVSEFVTGIDLVREQLRVASGESLIMTGRAPRSGHAIEVRVNAEDPLHGFAPRPGPLHRFRPPLGPGVRVDTFAEEGGTISPYYDSMIAKVIVHDDFRHDAIERMLRALDEFEVVGIPTTLPVLKEILDSEEFRSGHYSTSFIDEAGARLPALAGAA
jgi:acetyl-CoA carboxylase biotin carboxylase subunit